MEIMIYNEIIPNLKEKNRNLLRNIKKTEENMRNYEELTRMKLRLQFKKDDDSYLKELVSKYGSLDSYWQTAIKEDPEDIYKAPQNQVFLLSTEENTTQGEETKNEKELNKKTAVNKLKSQTEFLWQNLRIHETIDEKTCNEILLKMNSELEKLKNEHDLDVDFVNLFKELNGKEGNLKEIILKMIKHSTGTANDKINKAFSSKNPEVLAKMSHYLNLIIYNNRNALIGVKQSNKTVYRYIAVDNDVAKLYHHGEYMFFTALTPASITPQTNDKGNAHKVIILFEIKLLNELEQEKFHFYSGLNIAELSQNGENEVLISPYQIFNVSSIRENNDETVITLTEINDKELITSIMTPILNEETSKNKNAVEEKINVAKTIQNMDAKNSEIIKDVNQLNSERLTIKKGIWDYYQESLAKLFKEYTSEQEKEIRQILRNEKIIVEDSFSQTNNNQENLKYIETEKVGNQGCWGCGCGSRGGVARHDPVNVEPIVLKKEDIKK